VIPVETFPFKVSARSDEGRSGKNNEDRYAVSAYKVDEREETPSVFAIVADGIGGHQAGEVAAEVAVTLINDAVGESDACTPVETLSAAIIRAGEVIRDQAESEQGKRGMGATCVCAWVIGDRLYTASVGDSRVYLVRDQEIRQLSTDHTWVQEAIEHGVLTPDQARTHPNTHVIRRYLGSRSPVVPDIRLRLEADESDADAEENQGAPLKETDRLLLCTDGLTDLVSDREILGAMQTSSLDNAVQQLIHLANLRGGHDNITIVALDCSVDGADSRPSFWKRFSLFG
jgi:serine/threonine protein phosphatase PrpC